jgi:hypothetical protein
MSQVLVVRHSIVVREILEESGVVCFGACLGTLWLLQERPALCRDGRGDGRVRRCSMVCVAEVAEERRKQTAEQEQPQQKALEAKKEPTRARLEQPA